MRVKDSGIISRFWQKNWAYISPQKNYPPIHCPMDRGKRRRKREKWVYSGVCAELVSS